LAGAATFLIFCSKIPLNALLLQYLSDIIGTSCFKKELILVAVHVDFGPVSQQSDATF
jgi:hypothetical protein